MMGYIRDKLNPWIEHFQGWTKRKQQYVMVGTSLLVIYILHSAFVVDAKTEIQALTLKEITLKSDIDGYKKQAQDIVSVVNNSIVNPNSQRALVLKAELDDLDKQLAQYYKTLIPANEMSVILRKVLTQETGLKLVSVSSIPPQDVLLTAKIPDELKKVPNRAVLYKRGAKLVFTGGYEQTVNYLKKLENYGQHIFWDDFSYTVKEYPKAEVSITVYTLTSEEGWVGG